MPYQASGIWIMVKRKGKWVRWGKASTPEKARKRAAAMNMRVKHKVKHK